MDFGFDEIFPQLDKVPPAFATILQDMIESYVEAKQKKSKLQKLREGANISIVEDNRGKISCLYKIYTTEAFARTEAAIFLLDHHPLQGQASTSTSSFGLSGIPPTVFIRSKREYGCLVKYMEHDSTVAGMSNLKTVPREIQKVSISHIRFGCTDGHAGNTLVKRENGVDKLIVIDCEECCSNGFILKTLWWEKRSEAEMPFLPEMVNYVRALDADRDINVLKSYGWDVPAVFSRTLKIFTHFLKKSVDFQLTPKEIAVLARNKLSKHPNFNLHEMVRTCDRTKGDKVFIEHVKAKIDESLKEYAKKFGCGVNVGQKRRK